MAIRRGLIIALLAVLAWQWFAHHLPERGNEPTPTVAETAGRAGDTATTAAEYRDGLPAEAHATLALIARGGPFPYERDGIVFGNFERRLPEQPRGYYHEYTVPTPGVGGRGARRIVTGGDPPHEFYYSDDHYQNFRRIEGQP